MKLTEILEDKDGYLSYKRITGLLSFFVAIIIAFLHKDYAMVSVFIGYSAGCGAFTIPDNIKQRRGHAQKDFNPL